MVQQFLKHFHSAHPIKKTIIVAWALSFVFGIVFSIFFLAEHGIKETFSSFVGVGVTYQTVGIFWLIFIVRTFFFIPVSILMIAAPFIFGGFWMGLLIAGIGEIIGATLGFLLARYYGREFFENSHANSETIQILNEKMEEFGALAVGLLRITPVTFDLINFGAGLSKMRFSHYFWATALSVWPDCMVYVSIGGAIENPISIIYTAVTVVFLGGIIWYLKQHPEYRRIFIMEVKKRASSAKKKLGSLASRKKNKKRKQRF